MSKRKIAAGIVAILLIAGTVWAVMRKRPDPQVEKVKQLQAAAFKAGTTPEQRRQNFDLVRKEMDQLSPEQRHEVRRQAREVFQRHMDRQIATYFALPPAERDAFLDKQINEQEKWRKEAEARRARSGGQGQWGGGPRAGPPPQNLSTDARMQRRDQRLDNSTAQQRAMRSAYMADMRARRIQLGLPPSPFPGRGPR